MKHNWADMSELLLLLQSSMSSSYEHEGEISKLELSITSTKAENTNLRESITVFLASCLFWLDSAAVLLLNEQQFFLFGQIQSNQTGCQPYSDTSPIVVSVH